MRCPSLALMVVESSVLPGTLSVREQPDQRSGSGFRRALVNAGFIPGDHVVMRLAGDLHDAVARTFVAQLRDPAAVADPVAFVERWKSIVAELDQ